MSQTISGSRASLKINGKKVAFVGSVNLTIENTLTPINVIDQLEIAEACETGHVVNFTANYFKVDANSAAALGFEFENLDDLLSQPELTMEMYDRVGDKVIANVSGVKCSGGSGSIDARGVWNGTWNFIGRIGRGL